MRRTRFSPTDLRQLHRQLASWRQSQPSRTQLPEPLWAAAATLATAHGVSAVARLLGLDYYKLKRRVTAAPIPAARTTPSPTFVELRLDDALPGASGSCRVELCDRAGTRMTMHLPGDALAVLALAQAFWRRGR
jgi:hypothetical protein